MLTHSSDRLPRVSRLAINIAYGLALSGASAGMAQTVPTPDAAASSPAAPTGAADLDTTPATSSGGVNLDAVTVTATRRAQRLRDVPVAIVKISADAQLDLGAKSLSDVLQSVPGVNLDNVNGKSNGPNLTIRGVNTGAAPNPTVSVYVDDVPVGGSTVSASPGFDQRLLDTQSIEILKGPQGTLYGSSSMGGLLKYNSRTPDSSLFSGLLGGEVSSTRNGGTNYTAQGYVNVPLSKDVAGLRVAVFDSHDAGYIDAVGPAAGRDINRGDVAGARISLGLKPAKDLDVRLSYQRQTQKYDGASFSSFTSLGQPIVGDLVRRNLLVPEAFNTTNSLAALNLEYDTAWGKLYSITGYQTATNGNDTDNNEGYLKVMPAALKVQLVNSRDTAALYRTTQEFRFVSKAGSAVDWIAGIFHSQENSWNNYHVVADIGPGSPFPNPAMLNDTTYQTRFREDALYGTAVWNVSPTLAFTGGVRAANNSLDSVTPAQGLITSNSTTSGTTSESPITYLLAATYKVTPTASLYLRAASGYRAGGTNSPVPDPATGLLNQVPNFKSDSLWNYELGYKADLPRGLGNVEVALFQIDWKDIQEIVFDKGASYEGNAGAARIRGLELSGLLRPAEGWTARAAASLQDPKLLDDAPGLGGVAGNRLPQSAKVSANLNVRYDFESRNGPGFVAANFGYTGDRTLGFQGAAGNAPYTLPAYKTVDVNAGLTVAGIDFGAYVRNLTDERGQLSGTLIFVPVGGPANIQLIRPRTIGVTVSKTF